MPILKIETKPKREIQDLKDGKKQYIKSGPNKGNLKMKLKSPAKYKTELDVKFINNLFSSLEPDDYIVIEVQNPRPGNSAMSSASTMKNFGKLLALAGISNATLVLITPQSWKAYYGLTVDKNQKQKITPKQYKDISIAKALELSNIKTKKDGIADAIIIAYWFFENNTKGK